MVFFAAILAALALISGPAEVNVIGDDLEPIGFEVVADGLEGS